LPGKWQDLNRYPALKGDNSVKCPYAALYFSHRRCGVRQKYASLLWLRTPCLWTFYEAIKKIFRKKNSV
jgi:hypothetical protein